ncbi:hypothetical protein D3C76_1792750 [compost metagenome]
MPGFQAVVRVHMGDEQLKQKQEQGACHNACSHGPQIGQLQRGRNQAVGRGGNHDAGGKGQQHVLSPVGDMIHKQGGQGA